MGARFSLPVPRPTQPLIKWVPGIFPGNKRPGRNVSHPPPSSAEVKGRVELYIYSTSGPWCPITGLNFTRSLKLNRSPFVVTNLRIFSALDGGKWSAFGSNRFTSWEIAADTHSIGGCVGPRASLDGLEKRYKVLTPTGIRTPDIGASCLVSIKSTLSLLHLAII